MAKRLQRREFLKSCGLSAAALAASGLVILPRQTAAQTKNIEHDEKPKRKPNIIYILADDLGYGDLGCYGQEKIKTPNLDRLAAEGLRFTQHYAGSTVCAPSRCCLMTGVHTGHAEVRGNRPCQPEGQHPLSSDALTVGTLLKRAGYTTAAIGKWGLGPPGSTGDPNRQGFDLFYGYNCQRHAHHYYVDYLWKNDQRVKLTPGTYSHDEISREALDFIRENKDQPFFLYLPFTIPHAELAVPEDSLAQYKDKFPEWPYKGGHYGAHKTPHAAFAAMISRMDTDVGRIMTLLTELGLDDETIVMFSSDNGPHREGGADPAFFKSSGPLRGIKRDLYEGGIRVPLIARWPGRITPGTTSDHVSAFWDMLPTCAELAGVATPPGLDGISFVSTLLGKSEQQRRHKYLYWEFHEGKGKQAVRLVDWKGVRLKVRENPNGPIELYSLKTDLGERNNVAPQHPEIVKQIEKIMAESHTESEVFPFVSPKP